MHLWYEHLRKKGVWTVMWVYFYCELSEVSCLSQQKGYNTARRIQSSAVWRKQWHKSLPETLGHCQTQGYVNPFIFLLNTRYFEHSVRNLDTNLFYFLNILFYHIISSPWQHHFLFNIKSLQFCSVHYSH